MVLTTVLIYCLLVNSGFCLKSPLTNVNPKDLINEKVVNEVLSKYANRSYFEDLPLKIIRNASQNFPNNSCTNPLKKFVNDLVLLKPNALEILDSWGKLESGVWDGNIVWEGRFDQCLESNFEENVSGQYCGVYFALPAAGNPFGTAGSLVIAVCLPDTCTDSYISSLLTSVAPGIIQGVVCTPLLKTWNANDIAGIFVLCFLASLVVLSTSYECVSTYKSQANEVLYDKMVVFDSLIPASQQQQLQQPVSDVRHLILSSFSVMQNTKRLLDTTQRATDITCLHGIRFLSMSWVILGHSVLFLVSSADNVRYIARYTVDHYEFQVITNAFFSVDTFFFLSGLLVVYLGMRQLNRREGKMNVPMMYFYRYVRLTPPYAFLILISIGLFGKFGDGPYWSFFTQPLVDTCEKYWYTSLLYFSNLYPAVQGEECWAWGWYLSNDTQFYLLSPIFLWTLYKNRKIGIALIVFFLVASMSITGAFSAYTKQQVMAMTYGLLAKFAAEPIIKNGSTLESLNDVSNQTYSPYISDLYAKPWCRIGAYLVGMLTGYILHVYKNKVKMNKITVLLGWTTASIVNFLLVYCCYPYYSKGELWSVELAAFYNAVSRPVWCMGLAWVAIACVSGYGGPVNSLLSWKAFIPLSRLTYCSYLIHPLVISWFNGATEVQPHYSIYLIVTQFIFNLGMTTMFAYVVAMLVEFPTIALLKILQSKVGGDRAPSPPRENTDDENVALSSS